MISAVLFDFGGTLDADGLHWLDRFYRIYDKLGLSHIDRPQIKEAFYWADEQADKDPEMLKAEFRPMMERHARWQFQKLGLQDAPLESKIAAEFYRPAEKVLHRNRKILETLSYAGLKLGIVSNFYGNIETLCKEFGYSPFINVIMDSKITGLSKPDPAVFQAALDRLGVPASDAAFVGDSFERDMIPAKSIGMRTYWLLGDQVRTPPDSSKVDVILRSLEDLPKDLICDPENVA